MKFVLVLTALMTLSFAQTSFAATKSQSAVVAQDYETAVRDIVEEIVKESKLETVMIDLKQPNDLKRLKAALVKAGVEERMYFEDYNELRDVTLPAIKEIKNESVRDGEYFKVQMGLTNMAGAFGYQEQDN